MGLQESVRVAIVEDELIVAADLEASLQELGFTVVGTANDYEQAVALAKEHRPDLVLMDIQLHGEPGGLRAADTIRRSWNIPIVFLTAFTTDEMMQRAREAGAYGFLSKPFRVEDLNATILIALEQHRLGRELFAEHNWLVTMLASLSDGVIAGDTSGCVRYLNPAAEVMTKWTHAEAVGKLIEEVYPLRHMDGTTVAACQLRRALAARAPIPKERFMMHVRGDDAIPVEDAAAPIIEDGHLLGAVTIFQDVSARVEEEKQQQVEKGRLVQEAQKTHEVLGQTKDELRALSGRLISAQDEERRRVARELHDDLGQRTALMGWRLGELAGLADALPSQAKTQVGMLQDDLQHLSSGLRDVSHQLHPSAIADLGLETALRDMVKQQREQGIEITFVSRGAPSPMPTEVATAFYRVAQEASRNAAQHAAGEPILVTLSSDAQEVRLSIEDSGPGFDLQMVRQRGGLGLLSMQERARMLGAALDIRAVESEGTAIVIRVPVASTAGAPTG